MGFRFTGYTAVTAGSFPCCCCTLVGSLPLANNVQHSPSSIHGEEQVEQCEIIIYMVRSVRSRWNSVRL